MRYVSSIEACDKIFGHSRIIISHSFYNLKIHLEDEQALVHTDNNIEEVLEKASKTDTMLTAWFKLNKLIEHANQFLYTEIPHCYVYNEKNHEWTPRQRGDCIVRLPRIHPRCTELFHLRILLLNIRGATSFDDLKTVNNKTYKTFTQAAVANNLVENNLQWFECLEEAISLETCAEVRNIFSMILIHNNPINPSALQLWDHFKIQISRDFVHFNKDSEYISIQKSLQHIRDILFNCGRSLNEFSLPQPDENVQNYRIQNISFNYDMSQEQHLIVANQMAESLNIEQKVY